ncbi:MAG TPA: response regulator transcription factor [Desulfuromonadaceae bacterium]|nr:response regulator transcription factor [Desulfuromonadaceae bacterium]
MSANDPTNDRPIKVSIVEDDSDTRANLIDLLAGDAGLRCLGSYMTAEAALEGIPVEKPDVALVDINLPGMSGIECVQKLKGLLPRLQVLMLTTYEERELIFKSLRAGASGYLLKNMAPAELIQAVVQVYAGGSPMSMQIARKVVDHFQKIRKKTNHHLEDLTPREQEILGLLAQGYFYKEIADQLSIAPGTVKVHLHKIYEKLHVQSRTEATAKYLHGD